MKSLGKSLDGRDAASKYLNMYLRAHEFPELDQLTPEQVEGDLLQNLIENVGYWIATTRFRTQQNLWLGRKSKEDYFKLMKEVLEDKFPEHALFDPGESDEEWFFDMKQSFKKECERHCISDGGDVREQRKSPESQHIEPGDSTPTTATVGRAGDVRESRSSAESPHSDLGVNRPAAREGCTGDVRGERSPAESLYRDLGANRPTATARYLDPSDPFVNISSEQVSQNNASWSQQIAGFGVQLAHFGRKIDALEAKLDGRSNDEAIIELYRDNTKMKTEQIEALQKENKRLKRQLRAIQLPVNNLLIDKSHMAAHEATDHEAAHGATDHASHGQTMPTMGSVQLSEEPPLKKGRTYIDPTSAQEQQTQTPQRLVPKAKLRVSEGAQGIGGITVAKEMQRLWDGEICKKKDEELGGDGQLPKMALYKRQYHLCVGINPIFKDRSENQAWENAMTFVAMAMRDDQWKVFLKGELNDVASTRLCAEIEEQTKALALKLESEASTKPKLTAKPTLHSFSRRLKLLRIAWKQQGKEDDEIWKMIADRIRD